MRAGMIRKLTMSAVVVGLSAASVLGVASTSQAAFTDYCWTTTTTPTTDGNYVYTSSSVTCEGAYRQATGVGTHAQYFDWAVWNNRGSMVYNWTTSTYIAKSSSANCNGTGTFSYRTEGWGQNSIAESAYKWSANKSVTC